MPSLTRLPRGVRAGSSEPIFFGSAKKLGVLTVPTSKSGHCTLKVMSAITRATSRIRRLPTAGTSSISRVPILRRQTILPSSSTASLSTARSIITPARQFEQKRWSSAAAQAVEAEAEVEEEVWPVRVLPTVSDKDAQRLKRQRNVGM
jgi:hypothetical protein